MSPNSELHVILISLISARTSISKKHPYTPHLHIAYETITRRSDWIQIPKPIRERFSGLKAPEGCKISGDSNLCCTVQKSFG
jgi:hypothetical protein